MPIIFNFFLNSSNTSWALTGLTPDAIFALGIAKGKFKSLSTVLTILSLGNLIATVFKLAVTKELIFDFVFFFKIKVKGPGQNFS